MLVAGHHIFVEGGKSSHSVARLVLEKKVVWVLFNGWYWDISEVRKVDQLPERNPRVKFVNLCSIDVGLSSLQHLLMFSTRSRKFLLVVTSQEHPSPPCSSVLLRFIRNLFPMDTFLLLWQITVVCALYSQPVKTLNNNLSWFTLLPHQERQFLLHLAKSTAYYEVNQLRRSFSRIHHVWNCQMTHQSPALHVAPGAALAILPYFRRNG